MTKIFVLLFALVFSISACGNTPVAPVNLSGNWSTSSTSEPNMRAVIVDDTINVEWINDDKSTAIYWVGTLPESKSVSDSTLLLSAPDSKKLESSILASTATSKEFKYKDKKIGFMFVMMGLSKTLYLERH